MRESFGSGGEAQAHRAIRRIGIGMVAVLAVIAIGASAIETFSPAAKAQVSRELFVYTNDQNQVEVQKTDDSRDNGKPVADFVFSFMQLARFMPG